MREDADLTQEQVVTPSRVCELKFLYAFLAVFVPLSHTLTGV